MPKLKVALALMLAVAACSTPEAPALTIRSGARSEALSAPQLAKLAQVEVVVGDTRYAGPRVEAALLAAGVPAGVDVTAVGADGYRQVVNAATIGRDDVIVAIEQRPADGQLRLIVPSSPGLSVRDLVALEATPAAP